MKRGGGGVAALLGRTVAAFVLQIGGAACAFGFSLVLTRQLGADESGVYFLALTMASIAATLGRIGTDYAVIRFVAAEGEGRVGGLYRRAGGVVAAGTAAAAGGLALAAPALAHVFAEPALVGPLRWMAVAVVGANAATFHAQLLKGAGHVREGIFADAFLRPALLLAGFAAVGVAFGAGGAAAAYVGASAAASAVAWGLWRRRRPEGNAPFPWAEIRQAALPLYGVDLLVLVTQWAPTLLLGVWSTSSSVAVYSVAARLATLAVFVLTAVNAVVGPRIAEAYARGDGAHVRQTARWATALIVAGAGPLLAVYAIAPEWCMGWFGAEFEVGASSLVVLAVGQAFNVLAGPTGLVLMMTGHGRDVWWGMALGSVASLGVGVALVGPLGTLGAAAAATTAAALSNGYAFVAVRRRLGFWTVGGGGAPRP